MQIFFPPILPPQQSLLPQAEPAPSTKPLTPTTHISITSHPRPPCTRTSLVPISSPEAPQSLLRSSGTLRCAHNTAQCPSPRSSQPAHTTHRNQSVPSVPPRHIPAEPKPRPAGEEQTPDSKSGPRDAGQGWPQRRDGHHVGTATLCPVLESQKSRGRGMAPSA